MHQVQGITGDPGNITFTAENAIFEMDGLRSLLSSGY